MLKLHVIGGLLAAAMALPVMAASAESGKSTTAEPAKPAITEKIEVTAKVDPSFAFTGAEGGWEVVQHAYGRVDGRIAHVDNLTHPDYPIAKVALEDMVQRYPGA